MPRGARKVSQTGIYHIMLRGLDKRDIFAKNRDYEKFIEHINRTKEKADFTVYAYCLMTNHIHILLKTNAEELGNIVRRIAVGYAQYSNRQTGRTGHLFQNRYRSEAVETDQYFLTVLRYIHQNPIKACIAKSLDEYKWSSYKDYVNKKSDVIEPSFGLSYFEDMNKFIGFMKEKNDEECLEYIEKKRWIDEELKEYISSFVEIDTLRKLDIKSRNSNIIRIREKTKASDRQLSLVLSIGRGIISNAK